MAQSLERILHEAEKAGARGWSLFEWFLGSVARRKDRQQFLTPSVWRLAEHAFQRGRQKVGANTPPQ